jgi:myo-inositol-1(or 4)-monophosphatase
MLAGIIYEPVRQELFAASTQGAFLNGAAIRAQGASQDSEAVVLTDFPYLRTSLLADDYELFAEMVKSFRGVRRLGSVALQLAYVACGRADVAFSFNASAWDIAAGMFLVEQAGGRYLPLNSTRPESWPPVHFVATCPEFDLDRSVLKALPVL